MEEKQTRIAIIKQNKCLPQNCSLECKKCCPISKYQKACVEVQNDDQICKISELLCIGCGICVERCPFGAIQIVNLPSQLDDYTCHRYGQNMFKLHGFPTPQPGKVLGLIGANGIGKSTALKILGGKLMPNLGRIESPPT